jgi:hypothetical protein
MNEWLKEAMAKLEEPCVVCLLNATHSDGRRGDAYIGDSLQFDTLDPSKAHVFCRFDADHYADHWRGWYRGFAGGATIEVRPAP